jgi:TolB-like protein/tetratricopeptide (TPR) repeat protein
MAEPAQGPQRAFSDSLPEERLESWKAIALYLNRDVSTVQRWEKRASLPVHRHPSPNVTAVFAYKSELDAWREAGRAGLHPPPRTPGIQQPVRLIVLPFDNLSGNPDEEYFSDGITEEITTQLARRHAEQVAVIGRASAMRYKHRPKSIKDIGKEMGAEYVLEGSVRRAADRVRVTAQLIEAAPQTHVWADTFESGLPDVLSLQTEVAESIAKEIGGKLGAQPPPAEPAPRPVNPEAYEAYLKGLHLWSLWAPGLFPKCVEYLSLAVERDPDYAPAYALLALSQCGIAVMAPPQENCPRARATALRALEMDPSSAIAHTAMGWVKSGFDRDWAGAEQETTLATELDPGNAEACWIRAAFLTTLRRFEEAVREIKRGLEWHPASPLMNGLLAWVYYHARCFDQSIEQYRRTLGFDPNFITARLHLSWCYTLTGRLEEAGREFRILETAGYRPLNPWLAWYYTACGKPSEARAMAEELEERAAQQYVDGHFMAIAYAGLGDKERAFYWLERAFDERAIMLQQVQVEPFLDPLRDDPRFDDLLRRMNFPEVPRSPMALSAD